MPVFPIGVPEDVVSRTLLCVRGRYSFAADGGAVSTIAITSGAPIPSGSIILAGWLDILTAPTSGGSATIAVQVESAADIQAAAAYNGAPWSTTGVKLSSARTYAAAPIKTMADRNISIVIASAALTAGVFDVYLHVLPPAS
jgi:hypothetical protein